MLSSSKRLERRPDPLAFVRFELVEPRGQPRRALLAYGLQHPNALGREVETDPSTVVRAFAPDEPRALEPGQMTGDTRDREALAVGELLPRDPGVELDRDEESHLTAGDRLEDLAPQMAGKPEQNRSQLVCETERVAELLDHWALP